MFDDVKNIKKAGPRLKNATFFSSLNLSDYLQTSWIMNFDNEFPAPPEPADLAKLSMEAEDLVEPTEDQMITTPRTLRRADNLRQKMAARRIQRTWKHFYQEVKFKSIRVEIIHIPIMI